MLRKGVIVIVDLKTNRFHFTVEGLRSFAYGKELWFPIDPAKGVVGCIEEVIQDSGYGNHVVDVSTRRGGETFRDLSVTYSVEDMEMQQHA